MRAIIQRVKYARVEVQGETVSEIGEGLLIFLGVSPHDTENECAVLEEKIAGLRIFEDEQGKMNRSLCDTGGGALVVSQFTLYADCRKGRRPSFTGAAKPEPANALYEAFILRMQRRAELSSVGHGIFGAEMQVSLLNDGPVTIVLDTDELIGGKAI